VGKELRGIGQKHDGEPGLGLSGFFPAVAFSALSNGILIMDQEAAIHVNIINIIVSTWSMVVLSKLFCI